MAAVPFPSKGGIGSAAARIAMSVVTPGGPAREALSSCRIARAPKRRHPAERVWRRAHFGALQVAALAGAPDKEDRAVLLRYTAHVGVSATTTMRRGQRGTDIEARSAGAAIRRGDTTRDSRKIPLTVAPRSAEKH